MKVKIKENAKQTYINYMVISCHNNYSDSYASIMEKLSGKIVEVDTKHLFKNSFNIIDPENPDKIIDLQNYLVEEIIDDIRYLKMKCNYCGFTQDKDIICSKCKKTNFLENLK